MMILLAYNFISRLSSLLNVPLVFITEWLSLLLIMQQIYIMGLLIPLPLSLWLLTIIISVIWLLKLSRFHYCPHININFNSRIFTVNILIQFFIFNQESHKIALVSEVRPRKVPSEGKNCRILLLSAKNPLGLNSFTSDKTI